MESLLQLAGYARDALVFLLVLTVLVAVHELGHYWFARMFGMQVDAFAVMMGGLRQTDLGSRLGRRMASSWIVGLVVEIGRAHV